MPFVVKTFEVPASQSDASFSEALTHFAEQYRADAIKAKEAEHEEDLKRDSSLSEDLFLPQTFGALTLVAMGELHYLKARSGINGQGQRPAHVSRTFVFSTP
jgi:hypothetical protein